MDIQGVMGSVTDDDTIFTFVTLQSDGRLEFGTAGFCIGTFKQDTRRLAGLVGRRTFLRLYENPGIIYIYRSSFQQTLEIRNSDLYIFQLHAAAAIGIS